MFSTRSVASGATAAILGAYIYVVIPLVCGAAVLASVPASGGWSVALAILGFLIAAGFGLAGFERIRKWRNVVDLSPIFPGFSGRRIPIFSLLSVNGAPPEAVRPGDYTYSLGVAGKEFFVLRNGRSDDPHKLLGGRILYVSGEPVRLPLRDVRVELIERTDEDMKAGAIDTRDYAERLGAAVAEWALSTSVKTKVIPYAAYLIIDSGAFQLTAAVPSEVSDETLKALGEQLTEQSEAAAWLFDKAADKTKEAVGEELHDRAKDFVGDGAVGAYDQVSDLAADVSWLLNPDAASIGTTQGDRGRRTAQLIAADLRLVAAGSAA